MRKQEIIDAWARIRKIDNTIPDDVLDFMKDCALEKIEQQEEEVKSTHIIDERLITMHDMSKKVAIKMQKNMNFFMNNN